MEELSMESALTEDFIDQLFSGDPEGEDSAGAKAPEDSEADSTEDADDKSSLSRLGESGGLSEDLKAELFENSAEAEESDDTDLESHPAGGFDRSRIYSSISKALSEDGIFQDLDEEFLRQIDNPDAFEEAIDRVVSSRLSSRQRALEAGLSSGVPKSEVLVFQEAMDELSSINDNIISEPGDRGDRIRLDLIMKDFLSRGYDERQAQVYAKSLFDSGEDVSAAKAARTSLMNKFKYDYDMAIMKGRQAQEKERAASKHNQNMLLDHITNGDFFGGMTIDKRMRDKAIKAMFDNSLKTASGQRITALGKYALDHPREYKANIAMLFTLTDGFKDFSKLVNAGANKVVKQKFRDLEDSILSSANKKGGSLNYVSGFDPESNFSKY